MKTVRLMPLAGMNNVSDDSELQRGGDAPRLYVRDAVNVDLAGGGRATLRKGAKRVAAAPIRDLWQSPLHGDTFGAVGDQWVKVDTAAWDTEALATVGPGPLHHVVLNNLVCVAGDEGIFIYDGSTARRLTIETPAAPMVASMAGALVPGAYGVAVAWVRGSVESATSEMTHVTVGAGEGIHITLPYCMDPTVTGVRLYLTKPDGGELGRCEDYPIGLTTVEVPLLPELGAPPQFQYKSPMPSGRYLAYWRGRLLTARANVLRFSEPLAYHLHDERYGFIQLPQRITFVQPVAGGIWVGQRDHVVFLSGDSPDAMAVQRKASRPPVPGSATLMPAEAAGAELATGGSPVAVWLAENGHVVGTSEGGLVELHAGVMDRITAEIGHSVVLERRVITAVT